VAGTKRLVTGEQGRVRSTTEVVCRAARGASDYFFFNWLDLESNLIKMTPSAPAKSATPSNLKKPSRDLFLGLYRSDSEFWYLFLFFLDTTRLQISIYKPKRNLICGWSLHRTETISISLPPQPTRWLTAKPSTRQDAKSITTHNSAIQQINDQPDDNSSTLHRDQPGALIPR
jgi:hypothetical protein